VCFYRCMNGENKFFENAHKKKVNFFFHKWAVERYVFTVSWTANGIILQMVIIYLFNFQSINQQFKTNYEEPMNKWANAWRTNEPMNQWTNEPMIEEPMNQLTNDWRTNEPMNQWTNEPMIKEPMNQWLKNQLTNDWRTN